MTTYEFLLTTADTEREIHVSVDAPTMNHAAVKAVEQAAERLRCEVEAVESIRARQTDD